MEFSIAKLIIWPKDKTQKTRALSFDTEKVNVLTGGSGRGKSSIIHLIEYCLGSSRNNIAVGPIRQKSASFGLLIKLEKTELLIVRESTINGTSNSFFKIEDVKVTIPPIINEFPFNRVQILDFLNQLFSYSDSGLKENSFVNTLESQKPSFRTSTSLNYQPQNIVANQNVLFYKADNSVNREKLKIFFPYYLNIEDDEILEYKSYLKKLERKLRIEENIYADNVEKHFAVNTELLKLYHKAIDFGLIKHDNKAIIDDKFVITELEKVKDINVNDILIVENQTVTSSNRIYDLMNDERKKAIILEDLSRKLLLLNSVSSNNIETGNNIIQKEARLSPLTWILNNKINNTKCPVCQSETDTIQELESLNLLRTRMNSLLEKVKDSTTVLKKEINSVKKEITQTEGELNKIRILLSLENTSENKYNYIQTSASINKFIGSVETSLNEFMSLSDEISIFNPNELREEIDKIRKIVGQEALKKRYEDTISKLTNNIKKYALLLGLQGADSEITLDIKNELTLIFKPGTQEAFTLDQMGSGENYMGYHVSTLLGIHEYLIDTGKSKIAPLLIFDQPSQAYFPEGDDENDEDTSKLKNLFSTLSHFNKNTKGKVQIIVLEHAGEKNWNTFENIHMVERWRDNNGDINNSKLIPLDWI